MFPPPETDTTCRTPTVSMMKTLVSEDEHPGKDRAWLQGRAPVLSCGAGGRQKHSRHTQGRAEQFLCVTEFDCAQRDRIGDEEGE